MRRTRIKGVANIPQRKKNDITQKTQEELHNAKNDKLKKFDADLIEVSRHIVEQEIIQKPNKTDESLKLPSKTCMSPRKLSSISILDNIVLKEGEHLNTSLKGTEDNKLFSSSLPQKTELPLQKLSENVIIPGISDFPVETCQSSLANSLQETRKLKSPLTLDFRRVASPHNIGSDSDCAVPPASPNKINRSRIKAVPRLAHRKISFSASESEDESKKFHHRIRNDSQSSSLSFINEPAIEHTTTNTNKDVNSVIHRKCKRTEWSKKVAEARKEFASKFISGKPDRKRLTMMDLIFYNPTTNSMKKQETISKAISKQEENQEQENVDDPADEQENVEDPKGGQEINNKENDKLELSDEENAVPAPQIKIGPSGEIILDEKSLVIENKNTKKEREKIENSSIIDGNSDKPYGVFKKVKRSKDWSDSETLKFYKALSTIGTDFSLMCDLFPSRNRRELKMKFKKEERINQTLIDKALMQPCSFDFEELKKEFALEEAEKKEIENLMNKDTKKIKNTKSFKFSKIMNLEKEIENENRENCTDIRINSVQNDSTQKDAIMPLKTSKKVVKQIRNSKRKITERIKIPKKKKKLDISSVLNDSSDSDESVEMLWQPTQTRFGRKVKQNQFYQPQHDFDKIAPRKIVKPIVNLDPKVAELSKKPGSIMMISSKGDDGQPIVQIYMVTNDESIEKSDDGSNLVPIAMIKTGHTDDEAEEGEAVENNYTIPAENVEEI